MAYQLVIIPGVMIMGSHKPCKIAAFDNFRLPMRGGKRYTKGVLACEIWTEPWAGGSESRHGFFFFFKKGGRVGKEMSEGAERERIAYTIMFASILRQLSLCLEA